MSKQSTNPLLGEVRCDDCGGVRYVYQSKRKGKHLYTRCGACGIDQRTGAAPQAKMAQYVPVGTLATEPEPAQTAPEPAPDPTPATDTDGQDVFFTGDPVTIEPTPEPDSEPVPDQPEPKRGGGIGGLIFGLLLILAPALALLR